MDALYLLIPLSVLAMLAVLGLFAWALNGGQFDELEREGARVLDGERADADAPTPQTRDTPEPPALDSHQDRAAAARQECRR